MEIRLILLLQLLLLTLSIQGQQLIFKNCSPYTQINASNYDMNPASSKPFGYYSLVLPYMDGQKVTPCVQLTGIPTTAYIEIKCETSTAGAKICVGDENTLRACGQGQLRTCYSAPSSNVKLAFYCDTACEQVDMAFWYRFVLSEANPSDQWCESRPSDDYPSTLITAPTNIPTRSTKSNVKDNGITYQSSPFLVCFSIFAMLLSSICF